MKSTLPQQCRDAAKALKDCGSFETGQGILTDAADHITALTAERDAALAEVARLRSAGQTLSQNLQYALEILGEGLDADDAAEGRLNKG